MSDQQSPNATPFSFLPPAPPVSPNNAALTQVKSEEGSNYFTIGVPAACNFDTGAGAMVLSTVYRGLLGKIVNSQATDFLIKGSKVGDPGVLCLAGATTVITDDGNGNLMEVANSAGGGSTGTGPLFTSALVRGVVDTNVATPTAANAFALAGAGRDGLTYVNGQIALLMAQTNPQENGPYIVTNAGGGNGTLVRLPWWASGSIIPQSFEFKVGSEGTVYKNLVAYTACGAAQVVDTNDPVLLFRRITALILANQTFFENNGFLTTGLSHPGAGRVGIHSVVGVNFSRATISITAASGAATAQLTFNTTLVGANDIEVDSWAVAAATDESFYILVSQ